MTERFEHHITRIACQFPYPAYPLETSRPPVRPHTISMRQLRLAPLALLAVVIITIPLLLIQIGAVTLLVGDRPDLPDKLVDLVGQTNWQDAGQALNFPLKKPASLPDPDAVYLQNADTVIFVWLESSVGQNIALYQMNGEQSSILKQVEEVTTTTVNGHFAIWIDVPHSIQFRRDGQASDEEAYLVEGSVLIWLQDDITYRLETGGDLDTARALAESLVEMGTDPG